MKPGAGKKIGNAFENLCGRKLSLWLTYGQDKYQLISTRLSGGWVGARWRHAGDLAPNGQVGEEFRKRVLVECKHHRKDLLWNLYQEPNEWNLQGWWDKIVPEAMEMDMVPLIMFRQTHRALMVAVRDSLAFALATKPERVIVHRDMGIIRWEDFEQWDPQQFYELIKDV